MALKDIKDIAQWICVEHNTVEELAGRLRETILQIPSGSRAEWLKELKKRYEHYRAHMHKHMALEEDGGYLTPVLEKVPTLSKRVEKLKQNHGELSRLMDNLHHTLETVTPQDDLLIVDCTQRISNLLLYNDQHQEQENQIVLHAFMQDVGSRD